tara:strand:+ start:78 stop:596 length:519 start_codon:yes stop_codon:yes gene_type:complete
MRNIASVLFFCLALLPLAGCSQENFPTDEHFKSLLEENKDSYQKAVDKFLSRNLYRLEIMSNGELNVMPVTVNVDGLADMKELLVDNLHVDLINTVAVNDSSDVTNEVAFFNYRRGLVFAGEHKGLVYIVDDSSVKVMDQLDEIDRENEAIHGKRFYKVIEPNWYIFYEYFP